MKNALRFIRLSILLSAVLLSIVIYVIVNNVFPDGQLRSLRLDEWYGLTAVAYLYVTLLASPLMHAWPGFPWRTLYIKARRALGVSAFYFSVLHSTLTFFTQLGGFPGLAFLDNKYLFAISLGFVAEIILALLAATSFDIVIAKMGDWRWTYLHRFVYLAGMLIVVHVLLLGSHFTVLSEFLPRFFFGALTVLLLLEAYRFDDYLKMRFVHWPQLNLSLVIVAVLLTVAGSTMFFAPSNAVSVNIHAAHIQLARDALNQSQPSSLFQNLPGLNGDRNRRYTVSMSVDPVQPLPNRDSTIHFRVYDASSGNPVSLFRILYAWPMHLMIVDSTLTYFTHIHPTQQDNEFVITTQFPKAGLYHLYIQFQPFGGIEQQMAFTVPVAIGPNDQIPPSTQPVDTQFTKTFENYEVTFDTHGQLKASDMTLGNDKISFTIKDAQTKEPITTLKPFMGAFGHLTMINEETYDFIHVHPFNLTPPPADATSGPTVDFLPIGIYGPFKPGIYRAFGEFSTKVGTDFDTNFTVKIE